MQVSVCKHMCVCVFVVDYVCSVSGITLSTVSEPVLAKRDKLQVQLLGEQGTKLNIKNSAKGREWWLFLGNVALVT